MPGSAPAGASATRPGLRRRRDEPARRRGVSFFARHARAFKKRSTDDRPTTMPWPANCAFSSSSVASGWAASRPRTQASWPASANGFFRHAPAPRYRSAPALDKLDRTTFADRELLRRSPARAPASTARTIRSRRSNEYGFAIQAGLLNPATSLNHKFDAKGIPPIPSGRETL